jgi:hypothetical protein
LRSIAEHSVGSYFHTGRYCATDVITLGGDCVEYGSCPDVDNNDWPAVQLMRRYCVDDSVGSDVLGSVVVNSYSGANTGTDNQWRYVG